MLQRQGKRMSADFPTMPKLTLPMPSEIVDIAKERRKATEKYAKANAGQRRVVDRVLQILEDEATEDQEANDDGRERQATNCLFMEGEGGTGVLGNGFSHLACF